MLLAALGNPQRSTKHIVIAGTNGKGSTSRLVAHALQLAGHRVGHFTSPHLLRFTERIRIDGVELPQERVVELFRAVQRVETGCPRRPTFFEAVTAMALLEFAERAVDVAVLEVGLGGRLDATNVVDRELAVITPIGFDHQAHLGDTLAAIAGEKAGVMEAGKPVVVAHQPYRAAHDVLVSAAQAAGAVLHDVDALGALVDRPAATAPGLAPPYQRDNAVTARVACRVLDAGAIRCPDTSVLEAMRLFSWPGRYQWIDTTPPVLVDGAHNPDGMAALATALAADERLAGRALHLVTTCLRDRDPVALLRPVIDGIATLHPCPVHSARSRTVDELAQLWPRARAHGSAKLAIDAALEAAARDGGVVIVAGSLMLAGDALAHLLGQVRDPPVDG